MRNSTLRALSSGSVLSLSILLVAGCSRGDCRSDPSPRSNQDQGAVTAVNVARYLQLDPESALRRTNRKFRRRFQQVEAMLQARGVRFEQMGLAQLEELWQSAKLEDSR